MKKSRVLSHGEISDSDIQERLESLPAWLYNKFIEMRGNPKRLSFVIHWWLRGFDPAKEEEAYSAAGYSSYDKNRLKNVRHPSITFLISHLRWPDPVRVVDVLNKAIAMSEQMVDNPSVKADNKIKAGRLAKELVALVIERDIQQQKFLEKIEEKAKSRKRIALTTDEKLDLINRLLEDEDVKRIWEVRNAGSNRAEGGSPGSPPPSGK